MTPVKVESCVKKGLKKGVMYIQSNLVNIYIKKDYFPFIYLFISINLKRP